MKPIKGQNTIVAGGGHEDGTGINMIVEVTTATKLPEPLACFNLFWVIKMKKLAAALNDKTNEKRL